MSSATPKNKKRKNYTQSDVDAAVSSYLDGKKLSVVCKQHPSIPRRTITYHARKKKKNLAMKKPGPSPLIGEELESDLEAWIIAMQAQGHPVSRDLIMVKANKLWEKLDEETHKYIRVTRGASSQERRPPSITGSKGLGKGWIDRFMQRHPKLCLRSAQVIKRVRAEATEDGLRIFLIK